MEQIKAEAEQRLNEWMQNSSFDKMTCGGSLMLFSMNLCLYGGSLEKPEWMNGKKFDKFVTDAEFYSMEYDIIIQELFDSQADIPGADTMEKAHI